MDDLLPLLCVGLFGLTLSGISLFGPPLYAYYRGFTWYLWLLGGGFFGLVLLAALQTPKKPGLLPEEQDRIRRRGDRCGIGLLVLSLALTIFAMTSVMFDVVARRKLMTEKHVWESAFHPVRVTYKGPWTVDDKSSDTAEEADLVLVDAIGNRSYTIYCTPVDDGSEYSIDSLHEHLQSQFFDKDDENRLIDASEVEFHGGRFHRVRFRMRTDWGIACVHQYVRLPAGDVVLQMIFPLDEVRPNPYELPDFFRKLDEGVELDWPE